MSSTLPSHDFYQNTTHLTLGVYVKGYGGADVKDKVDVQFGERSITITLPPIPAAEERTITFDPLYDGIVPGESTARVLSTKIELKLAKSSAVNWPTLLRGPNDTTTTRPAPAQAPSTSPVASTSAAAPAAPAPVPKKTARKDWDKLVDDELEDKEESKDPNAGGDAALQSFFSQIYANADEDTKRAMIKSFTESGGTSLSTDWGDIGKETTPIRPPEGMEARRYE